MCLFARKRKHCGGQTVRRPSSSFCICEFRPEFGDKFRMSDIVYPNRDEAPYGVARLGEKYTLQDIFDKFPKQEKNFVNYYTYLAASTVMGLAVPIGINNLMRKKLYYKPFMTLASGTIMFLGMRAILYYQEMSAIRTEAICRDYIRLHPDRFPPVGKFGFLFGCDLFESVTKRIVH